MTRFDIDESVEAQHGVSADCPRALLWEAREVPLGGVRAMTVRRALPQRELPMVGAWCFLDRFGPQTTRMRVEPHPHIGLQTVTWPLVGEVHHRDTIGSDVVVRRGVLNLMTSGKGIAHSEYSVGEHEVPLDALQLWVALPEDRRHGPPEFDRYEDLPVVDLPGGAQGTVVVGSFAGVRSPAAMHTPIAGVEVRIPAGTTVGLPLDPDWEYALVGIEGGPVVEVAIEGDGAGEPATLGSASLLYLGIGRREVTMRAASDVVLFLLGGTPFEADIVMWWNFVGRTHEEIVAAREEWEAGTDRFGHVVGHGAERIPAPPMPGVRLRERRRRV